MLKGNELITSSIFLPGNSYFWRTAPVELAQYFPRCRHDDEMPELGDN